MPPGEFQWPFEEIISKEKTEKRFLRLEHLHKIVSWFCSQQHHGLYCKAPKRNFHRASVKSLRQTFQNWREGNGSGSYEKVFEDAQKLLGKISVDQLPGSGRQPRQAAESPHDYYRTTKYLPFIDFRLAELDRRFLKQSELALKLSKLLPEYIVNHNPTFD